MKANSSSLLLDWFRGVLAAMARSAPPPPPPALRLRAVSVAIIAVYVSICSVIVLCAPGARVASAQTPPPQAGPSPTGLGQLALTDLTLYPPTIQLSWSYPPPPGGAPAAPPSDGGYTSPSDGGYTYASLVREPGGPGLPYALDGTTTYFDDENWTVNTTYGYHIHGTHTVWYWDAGTSAWTESTTPWDGPTYKVTVRQVAASACQTVDSRIDPRYSTYVLKNFQFGNRLYRGGLYAGFNADNSNVGRTYLKFTGLAGPTSVGEKLWPVGGLNLYCPRLARTGSASLQCRATASDGWDPTTLVWGNAPEPLSSGLGTSLTVSWDGTMPGGQWVAPNVTPDLEKALAGDGTLSLVIRASSEGGSGATTTASPPWAYFARPAYIEGGASMGPYLLYAFGGPGALAVRSVTVSPASISVSAGGSATVTVSLNAQAPPGDAIVSLTSSGSCVTVPATLTIPAGSSAATFTVTGVSPGTATIAATLGSGSASATVTVNP